MKTQAIQYIYRPLDISDRGFAYVKITVEHLQLPGIFFLVPLVEEIRDRETQFQIQLDNNRDNNLRHSMDVVNTQYDAIFNLQGKFFPFVNSYQN